MTGYACIGEYTYSELIVSCLRTKRELRIREFLQECAAHQTRVNSLLEYSIPLRVPDHEIQTGRRLVSVIVEALRPLQLNGRASSRIPLCRDPAVPYKMALNTSYCWDLNSQKVIDPIFNVDAHIQNLSKHVPNARSNPTSKSMSPALSLVCLDSDPFPPIIIGLMSPSESKCQARPD